MSDTVEHTPAPSLTGIRLLKFPVSARGVTDHVLKEAVAGLAWPDYSLITYIAPTPRKLRDARQRFHRMVTGPYIPPGFVTLKQMARSFFSYNTRSRIFPDTLAPLLISEISSLAVGHASILADIMKELKQHYPSKDLPAIRQELRETFQRRGLPEDMISSLDRAFGTFEQYQTRLSSAGYADEDDILIRSCSAVSTMTRRIPRLVIDGFYDMTRAELVLLEGLIRLSDAVLMTYPFTLQAEAPAGYLDHLRSTFRMHEEVIGGKPETDMSYIRYADIEDEVEGIARHIKNLYIAGAVRPSDSIVLTAPQLSTYRSLFVRVLTRYGLPYSMTMQQPYAQKAPLRDLLYLIEAVADDFPRQKFTAFLNSPYFANIPELVRQWAPAISLKCGIVKGREAWENINPDAADRNVLGRFGPALRQVFEILYPMTVLRDGATAPTIRTVILTVMKDLGFSAEEGLQKRFDDALVVLNILPELAGRATVGLSRYAEFLRHILNAPEYISETEGIQVMEFAETRGLEPDHLYFCGLKDGEMPAKPPVDHVLPDSIRRESGLTGLATYLHTQKVYFLRTVGASAHRHLSYPSVEGDKVFLQSPYLPWGKEREERVYGVLSRQEHQVKKGFRPFEEMIKEISPDAKAMNRLRKGRLSMPLRVTDVDNYRKCPRRFYLEKILGLEASRITEYGIEARILGTLFHAVMERLFTGMTGSDNNLHTRACGIFDSEVRNYHLDAYWRDLLRASFLAVLPEIIDLETVFRGEGFMPFRLEMEIAEEEVLPGISLKGKIDRVDSDSASFRIIDYKTGAADIGSAVIKSGKDLQLPLYAAMLRNRGMAVLKAGIYSLNSISIKWIPTSRDKNSIDNYIDSALSYLAETVGRMQAGDFIARPLEEFFCTSCAEVPYCPYINVSGSRRSPAGCGAAEEASDD